MTAKEITFSPEKALESVTYIASKLTQPTVHEVLKIRYFADKLHLADFDFMASGGDDVAMKFGPVATTTYLKPPVATSLAGFTRACPS